MTSGLVPAMPRRLVLLGEFAFVIIAVGVVSVDEASWYWAAATEALVLSWLAAYVMPRRRRNSGGTPTS